MKLGDGVLAPTVFGDENVDAVLTHECEFAVEGVRAAGEKELHPVRKGRLRRINTPNEKPEGRLGEGGEPLPPGGEEEALTESRQQGSGFAEGGDPAPVVPVLGRPSGTAQRENGHIGESGGNGSGLTDPRGKGMSGINYGVGTFGSQPLGHALGSAKPANPHLADGKPRLPHPPSKRGNNPHPTTLVETCGKLPSLPGPPEHHDTPHTHHLRTARVSRSAPASCVFVHPAAAMKTQLTRAQRETRGCQKRDSRVTGTLSP